MTFRCLSPDVCIKGIHSCPASWEAKKQPIPLISSKLITGTKRNNQIKYRQDTYNTKKGLRWKKYKKYIYLVAMRKNYKYILKWEYNSRKNPVPRIIGGTIQAINDTRHNRYTSVCSGRRCSLPLSWCSMTWVSSADLLHPEPVQHALGQLH